MLTEYTVRLTFAAYYVTPERADQVLPHLAPFGGTLSEDDTRRVRATLTVPGAFPIQAALTAVSVAESAFPGARVARFEVLPSAEFEREASLTPIPDLLSVTQAADALGVSRQAVLKRLESGSLQGRKVGETWVVPASAVAPRAASA